MPMRPARDSKRAFKSFIPRKVQGAPVSHFPNLSLLPSLTFPMSLSFAHQRRRQRGHEITLSPSPEGRGITLSLLPSPKGHGITPSPSPGRCGVDLRVSPAGHEVAEWSRDLVEGCEVVPDSWGLAGPDLDHHNLKSPRPRDTCETSTTTSPKPEPIHIRTL